MQSFITLNSVNTDILRFDFWKDKLADIVFIIIILAITFFATRLAKYLFNRAINRVSDQSHVRATSYRFLRHIINATIVMIGLAVAIYAIPPLRALSVSIFAGAGILAAIFGFASQQAFSNIVSGIFIVIFKPYRVNDRIEVGKSYSGVVEDITLRHTVIRSGENKRVVIPNAVISNETIINATLVDERICKFIDVSISYDANIDKAMEMIQDEAMKHPYCIDGRTFEEIKMKAPVVDVKVISLGESSVNLRAFVWTNDYQTAGDVGYDLNKSIKERFEREGIQIPYPHRTLIYKRDQ